ncbi:hypothetical protein ACWFPY_25290 [Nocardia fluminea]
MAPSTVNSSPGRRALSSSGPHWPRRRSHDHPGAGSFFGVIGCGPSPADTSSSAITITAHAASADPRVILPDSLTADLVKIGNPLPDRNRACRPSFGRWSNSCGPGICLRAQAAGCTVAHNAPTAWHRRFPRCLCRSCLCPTGITEGGCPVWLNLLDSVLHFAPESATLPATPTMPCARSSHPPAAMTAICPACVPAQLSIG